MKYTIRKRENVKLYLASQPAELNDEHFRNLEQNPYTGNSEEEFLKYISEFSLCDDPPSDLHEESALEIQKLGFEAEMLEFDSSAQKGADIWFESGVVDNSKYGNFNRNYSTNG